MTKDVNVVELRKNGKTYPEIQKITNLSLDKIKKISRDNNLNKSTGKFKPKKVDIQKLIESYKETKSLRKTGEIFNLHRETVRKYIPDSVIKTRVKKISKSGAVMSWRKRTKTKLIEYKGGKCEICNYNKCERVLQFHHKDPNEKDFQISGKSYSFERLKNEVDKCVLVCSNCHGEIHDNLIKL